MWNNFYWIKSTCKGIHKHDVAPRTCIWREKHLQTEIIKSFHFLSDKMKTSVTLFYTFRLWKHILSQTFTFDLFTPFLTLQSLPRLWALYVVTEVSFLNFLSNVSLFMFRLTSYPCSCQSTFVSSIVIEYLLVKGYLIK